MFLCVGIASWFLMSVANLKFWNRSKCSVPMQQKILLRLLIATHICLLQQGKQLKRMVAAGMCWRMCLMRNLCFTKKNRLTPCSPDQLSKSFSKTYLKKVFRIQQTWGIRTWWSLRMELAWKMVLSFSDVNSICYFGKFNLDDVIGNCVSKNILRFLWH